MKRHGAILWIVTGLCTGAMIARGGEIKVPGEKSDCGVSYPETLDFVGRPSGRVGAQAATPAKPENIVLVLVFKLPDLPANATIVSADLQINLEATNTPQSGFMHKADLYGVRTDSDNKVVASDYFFGETDSDKQATLIQGGMLTKETAIGLVHTDADGGKKLAQWLTDVYKGGGTGQYVFLRLNPDVQSAPYRYFLISTADNSQEELRPVLTIKTK